MHFDPSLHHHELPAYLNKAIQIGTPAAWKFRYEKCAAQAADNPPMADYLAQRFGIELAMEEVRRYLRSTGRIPSVLSAHLQMHRLYAFAAMMSKVHERLSPAGQKKLSGRLRGGLTDDTGIAGVVFEMEAAANLMLNGVDVTWHDLEGAGGFDMLGRKNGLEAEIECKSFSGDIGRKIHLRRQYQLGGLLNSAMAAALENRGPLFVDVTIPDRLSGADVAKIAERVEGSLGSGIDFAGPSPCSVSMWPLPMDHIPFDWSHGAPSIDQDAVSDAVQATFGRRRRNFLALISRAKGAVLIGLSSQQDDAVVKGIYREIRHACSQLSGTRPGVVCAHLLDMTPAQLQELHDAPKLNNQPTGLHLMVGRVFGNAERGHVHTLRFSVPGMIERSSEQQGGFRKRHISERGPSFVFTNNTHPLAKELGMAAFR